MSTKLDFTPAEHAVEETAPKKRWKSRERIQTVQMSVRMDEDVYDRFRELCERERRTNGKMLERMMMVYLKQKEKGQVSVDED